MLPSKEKGKKELDLVPPQTKKTLFCFFFLKGKGKKGGEGVGCVKRKLLAGVTRVDGYRGNDGILVKVSNMGRI